MTETPVPTETLIPSPTPNYYVEMTTPAGEPARVSREMSIADYWIILLLVAILLTHWSTYFLNRLKGDKAK